MPNRYNGSRSPVRAINTATHPTWVHAVPQPRTWSEPTVQEIAPAPAAPQPAAAQTALACPDCGSMVRLALIPATVQQSAPAAHSPRHLRPAPDPGGTEEFEDSVRRYKRELISRALETHDGVMTRAARALGLKYTTFVAMVHRLEVLADGEESPADVKRSAQPPQR
jgi:hypothetical protein